MHRKPQDIEYTATYRVDGFVLGYTVRFRTSKGGKDVLPYTWCVSDRDGAAQWRWRQWDEPRPLYYPGGKSLKVLQGERTEPPTVVVVEGERKADALHALLEAGAPGVYLVASWPGGCKVWSKALWPWLAGCTVLLWPDCDAKHVPLNKSERDQLTRALALAAKPLLPQDRQPGMRAMLGIGAMLRRDHGCAVLLLPIPEPGAVPDGWDCADAIATDGWQFERVQTFLRSAAPLPADTRDDGHSAPPGHQAAQTAAQPAQSSGLGNGGRRAPQAPGGPAGDALDVFTVDDTGVWFTGIEQDGKRRPPE